MINSLWKDTHLVESQRGCWLYRNGVLGAAGWWWWQKVYEPDSHPPELGSMTLLYSGRWDPPPYPDPEPSCPPSRHIPCTKTQNRKCNWFSKKTTDVLISLQEHSSKDSLLQLVDDYDGTVHRSLSIKAPLQLFIILPVKFISPALFRTHPLLCKFRTKKFSHILLLCSLYDQNCVHVKLWFALT